MKYVFIDSNIWLSLYSLTSGDLNQFEKLKDYKGKSINLIIPSQVKDEVMRNRESKFNETLKGLQLNNITFPSFTHSYERYDHMKCSYNSFKREFNEWVNLVKEDFVNGESPSDKVILSFFDEDSITNCDDELIAKAIQRFNVGNPPGKDKKYGDAINWECLLQTVPEACDLYLISNDGDFKSSVKPDRIKPFLAAEWREKKKAKVILYDKLNDFLKDHLGDIKLETEQLKEDLIEALRGSLNFRTTHLLVKQLSEITDWSDEQVVDLCEIAVNNTQVHRILTDSDIENFYRSLINGRDELIKRDKNVESIYDLVLDKPETIFVDAFDIPF